VASARPLTRALRRLAPRRGARGAWRVGPWPERSEGAGRGCEGFVLLAGGPVQLLADEVVITVREGAVLQLSAEEHRRLIVLDAGRDPVWLSLGPGDGGQGGGR
jgi:hypothetical protein